MKDTNGGGRWESTTIVDQAAIDHESRFGTVPASGETVLVRAAQRVEFNLLTDPVEDKVHPVRIHVGDSEFSVPQGRELHEALGAALKFAEEVEAESRPEDPKTE